MVIASSPPSGAEGRGVKLRASPSPHQEQLGNTTKQRTGLKLKVNLDAEVDNTAQERHSSTFARATGDPAEAHECKAGSQEWTTVSLAQHYKIGAAIVAVLVVFLAIFWACRSSPASSGALLSSGCDMKTSAAAWEREVLPGGGLWSEWAEHLEYAVAHPPNRVRKVWRHKVPHRLPQATSPTPSVLPSLVGAVLCRPCNARAGKISPCHILSGLVELCKGPCQATTHLGAKEKPQLIGVSVTAQAVTILLAGGSEQAYAETVVAMPRLFPACHAVNCLLHLQARHCCVVPQSFSWSNGLHGLNSFWACRRAQISPTDQTAPESCNPHWSRSCGTVLRQHLVLHSWKIALGLPPLHQGPPCPPCLPDHRMAPAQGVVVFSGLQHLDRR